MKYSKKIRYSRKMKIVAVMLMNVFTCQLLYPNIAMALTTGPTQPEVQGFEPVGTTDMVDMFSGSFVYNIPLLDVEGYPINISYHGGVTMEQEASWVGLGWNINPGVINRTVRGVPDDFNGDVIHKDFNMKPEKTTRTGIGAGLEVFGVGDPKTQKTNVQITINPSANLSVSNYRGVSCDFSLGVGINVFHSVSAGINLGVGSQTGASLDYNGGLSSAELMGKDQSSGGVASINAGVGGGYSTRSGVKDLSLSISASYTEMNKGSAKTDHQSTGTVFSANSNIPIGIKNFVPVITNSSTMNTIYGRIKVGPSAVGFFAYGTINGMQTTLSFVNDASREAYGYMYLQNASIANTSILDFCRDKDGMFNATMKYLPVPNMTYDVYSLSGQGTGGVFRPFRNDFGNVYDPYTTSSASSTGGEGEVGIGNLWETGVDITHSRTEISSGPWLDYHRAGIPGTGFTSTTYGSIYENVYFKAGGELTPVDTNYFATIGKTAPITPDAAMRLPQTKPVSNIHRDPRANLIYYHTAQEDTVAGVGTNPDIINYTDTAFTGYGNPSTQVVKRIGTGEFQRKKDQISEIVQVQKDGRKYVYGIPALNNVQREVTFSVDPVANHVNLGEGTVAFGGNDATNHNSRGTDNYYNSTVTPAYAHSYLLTSVLSSDYVDVTGNGPSDDDLGSFTKINYTRTDSDYRWVTPYSDSLDTAQYSPGFWSDHLDDKGSFVCGSREQWNVHSIESRNFIAEFYTSPRHDAHGISARILNSTESSIFNSPKSSPSLSYKLDSIILFNKHDRFVNGAAAVPVKTVYFVYDYSLCPGITNSDAATGKLTLKNIYFKYGNSQKSMISPYQFGYGPNPGYDLSAKDRWGNYKPNNTVFTNYEFPYVNQNDTADNSYASAWSLNSITLPSGGIIQANYESNDYAFVQDKPANEMFMVQGLGNSPNFVGGSQLYKDKSSPYLYAYFLRRQGSELSKLSFAQNYLGVNYKPDSLNCMYFNFNLALTGANNTYEQVKGYVNVTDIGVCGNNLAYGYVKFQYIRPDGGWGLLNPITYTALNTARYNLPQIVYPGSDLDQSDFHELLAGLKGAFNELLEIGTSPVLGLVRRHGGQNVNLNKSFIRLQSVGLTKKGGGQRVKSLYFYDQWNALAGGNDSTAYYGKQYIYANISDPTYGAVSSGVASYEPLIGGDENPLRQPLDNYAVQSGVNFPPNDPVDLYQEGPIGESLFPPAQVGYSNVLVVGVHVGEGRSSKSLDQYQFYTAREFPAQVITTSIITHNPKHSDFFSQSNLLTATQGYTLIFNDMHGKPKKVEHDVINSSGTFQPISYQLFNYRQNGNQLNNTVNCLVYNGSNMVVQPKQLGIEEDVTFDSRQKNEHTFNSTYNANFNFFYLPPTEFVGFPFGFAWFEESQTEFQSAVVTKVIQQYGILDNVVSYKEGATTTLQNELYDPTTGQAVVTSTTNEFMDKEYTTSVPASWVYSSMSPSYSNISYKDTGTITVGPNHIGTLNITNTAPLTTGDELSVSYKDASGNKQHTTAWVMGMLPTYSSGGVASCGGLNVLPRFPLNTAGWNIGDVLQGVRIEVISSGHKNMLTENAETYTSMDSPTTSTGVLKTSLSNLIDLKAKTFSDSNTRIMYDYIANADTVNPFAIGERGEWRLLSEYAYKADRNYTGVTTRNAGLYSAKSMFLSAAGYSTPTCTTSPYNFLAPYNQDSNWHAMRTVTKWSPSGKEIENKDAVGNYSTAVYSYNQELPVAVAANAKQGDILTLGFEDYHLLEAVSDIMPYQYFLNYYTDVVPLSVPSPIYHMTLGPSYLTDAIAHTGLQSLFVPTLNFVNHWTVQLPVDTSTYSGLVNNYNNYFSNSPVGGYIFSPANEYRPFELLPGKNYILNYWVYQPPTTTPNITDYNIDSHCGVMINGTTLYPVVKKSNIIDGWQQVEVTFTVPSNGYAANMILPAEFYVDDLRIYPAEANMKSFVYGPVSPNLHATNEKLMATLDENNYATMYEYDQEGNLVRTKKETSKGIMTISESRSGNPKKR